MEFPTVGLLTMGVVTAAGFVIGQLTSLTVLIQLLTVVMVLVQALAQILALTVLRRRQPTLRRPYRMCLYPLPSILAALGWIVIYGYADKNAPGLHPIELSLLWIVVGVGRLRALGPRQAGVAVRAQADRGAVPARRPAAARAGRGGRRRTPPSPEADPRAARTRS